MQIGPFQTKGEKAKVKVKVRLNLHGIVSVESATVSLFRFRDCINFFPNIHSCEIMIVNPRAFVLNFFRGFFFLKLLEEEEIEVPVVKESAGENAKMETDEAPADAAAPPSSNDIDVNMQDAKATADTPGAENGIPETGDKPVQMETDTKVDGERTI